MTATHALNYSVEAYNVSHASENKIHDDTVAKKLGFTGGLVPGVEVFAYMSHVAVAKWGRAFLERGRMEARFGKPLYDGRMAHASGVERADGGIDLKLESDGALCATGAASMGDGRGAPSSAAYQWRAPPAAEARPPASETSLAEGTWLSIAPAVLTKERSAEYLGQIKERHEIYARDGLAHPGLMLRLCNSLLRDNVKLPPWVHVGSDLKYFAAARVGETLAARGRVVKNYERKGHRLVDIDCVLTADDKPVAHVLHTAIYGLRHLAEKA